MSVGTDEGLLTRVGMNLLVGGLVVAAAGAMGLVTGLVAALWGYFILLLAMPLYGFDEDVHSTATMWIGIVVGGLFAVGWLGRGLRQEQDTPKR